MKEETIKKIKAVGIDLLPIAEMDRPLNPTVSGVKETGKAELVGVEEIKDFFTLIAYILNLFINKKGFMNTDTFKKVYDAVEGINEVPYEYADLSIEEAEYLLESFKMEFNIENDPEMESIIEDGFTGAFVLAKSAFRFFDLKKKRREESKEE